MTLPTNGGKSPQAKTVSNPEVKTATEDVTSSVTSNASEGIKERSERIRLQHPDYCSIADVCRALGVTRASVHKSHKQHIKNITIEDVTLFHRASVTIYASQYKKDRRNVSVLSFRGIDIDRLERIADKFYRQNRDTADRELLVLAKRIAKL